MNIETESKNLYSPEQRLNTILGEQKQYFAMLRRAKAWFTAQCEQSTGDNRDFYDFLEEEYGIRVLFDSQGLIKNGYTVLDELKHTKFLLTFC
jgi:hypothetical protein